MGFDAGKSVEALDWDFTAFGGEKGTIPEPSEAAVTEFQRSLRDTMKDVLDLDIGDNATAEQTAEAMRKINEIDTTAINQHLKEAMARLCQDQPSVQQLDLLPYRVLNQFAKWLQGELSPEAGSAGTRG